MHQEQKLEVSDAMYTYRHHCSIGVDVHEIFVKRSRLRVALSYIGIIFLLANVSQPLLSKESLSLGSVWNITFAVVVAKCLQYKPVKRGESFIVDVISSDNASFWGSARDTFLESSIIGEWKLIVLYGLGTVVCHALNKTPHRKEERKKILKPLINECVTPVTCYWSLALLLRDEEELLLVFQRSRPPVKMLVPVWKALCTLTNSEHPNPSQICNRDSSET